MPWISSMGQMPGARRRYHAQLGDLEQSYLELMIADGMTHFWPCYETSDTTFEDVIGSSDMTVIDQHAKGYTMPSPLVDVLGVRFNVGTPAGYAVSGGSESWTASAGYGMEGWVELMNTNAAAGNPIFAVGGSVSLRVEHHTAGGIRFVADNGAGGTGIQAVTGLSTSTSYHTGIYIDDVNQMAYCYINGSHVGTLTAGLNGVSTSQPMYLHRRPWLPTSGVNAYCAVCRVGSYNFFPTDHAAIALAHYNKGVAGF